MYRSMYRTMYQSMYCGMSKLYYYYILMYKYFIYKYIYNGATGFFSFILRRIVNLFILYTLYIYIYITAQLSCFYLLNSALSIYFF